MITDRELEVLECVFNLWLEKDMPLYGHLSYQDVINLLEKLGMEGEKARLLQSIEALEQMYSPDYKPEGKPPNF